MELDWDDLQTHWDIRYLIVGREVCPDTKNEHWQGYIELKNGMTMQAVKSMFGDNSTHLEIARGNSSQNREYCMKEKKYKEYGTPSKQGERNDIKVVVEDINEGMRYDEVAMTHPCQFVKYCKGFKEYSNALARTNNEQRDVEVIVMVGPTGCGKTSYVYENEEDLFDMICLKQDMQWFDGYEGQSTLLLDEFGENSIQWEFLLRLLDRYPLRLPVKGTFCYAKWNKVYITSNLSVNKWFTNRDLSPLMRRISCIHDFYKKKSHIIENKNFKTVELLVTQKLPGNTIPATVFDDDYDSERDDKKIPVRPNIQRK